MEFRKDLDNGTVVRTFGTGVEAVIVDKVIDTAGLIQYTVEFNDGRRLGMGFDELAPPDHPFHRLLDDWNEEGLRKNFKNIFIGHDDAGKWYCFFGVDEQSYHKVVKENRHLKFKYYWRLRGIPFNH